MEVLLYQCGPHFLLLLFLAIVAGTYSGIIVPGFPIIAVHDEIDGWKWVPATSHSQPD